MELWLALPSAPHVRASNLLESTKAIRDRGLYISGKTDDGFFVGGRNIDGENIIGVYETPDIKRAVEEILAAKSEQLVGATKIFKSRSRAEAAPEIEIIGKTPATAAAPKRVEYEVEISWENVPTKAIPIKEMPDIKYKFGKASQLKAVYWSVEIDYIDKDEKPAVFQLHSGLPNKLDKPDGLIKMTERLSEESPSQRDLIEGITEFQGLSGEGKLRIALFDGPTDKTKEKAGRRQLSNWLSLPIKIVSKSGNGDGQ